MSLLLVAAFLVDEIPLKYLDLVRRFEERPL